MYSYTALIILNYNNYEDTINCIHSVEQYNTAPVKYIVVDNGSTRNGVEQALDTDFREKFASNYNLLHENEEIPKALSRMTLLVSSTNDGYACGNNKGLQLAYKDRDCKHVMILNNDVLFVEDIIPRLLNTMKTLPDCAIISPLLYKKGLKEIDYNCARKDISIWGIIKENIFHYYYRATNRPLNAEQHILRQIQSPYPDIIPIELPSGSCMLMEKEYFWQIGSFDPRTFLYYEENILFKKVQRSNRRNYLCTNIKCIHLGAQSTSKTPSLFMYRVGQKSVDYYVKNYLEYNVLTYQIYRFSAFFYKCSLYVQKKIMRKDFK